MISQQVDKIIEGINNLKDEEDIRLEFLIYKAEGLLLGLEEELEFLLSLQKWRNWEKISMFAHENIRNEIKELEINISKLKEAIK